MIIASPWPFWLLSFAALTIVTLFVCLPCRSRRHLVERLGFVGSGFLVVWIGYVILYPLPMPSFPYNDRRGLEEVVNITNSTNSTNAIDTLSIQTPQTPQTPDASAASTLSSSDIAIWQVEIMRAVNAIHTTPSNGAEWLALARASLVLQRWLDATYAARQALHYVDPKRDEMQARAAMLLLGLALSKDANAPSEQSRIWLEKAGVPEEQINNLATLRQRISE